VFEKDICVPLLPQNCSECLKLILLYAVLYFQVTLAGFWMAGFLIGFRDFCLAIWLACWISSRLPSWFCDWLSDCLTHWLFTWLTFWLAAFLAVWLCRLLGDLLAFGLAG